MNAKINYSNLIRQLLPIHKRQPVRLSLFRTMIAPLLLLFAEFEVWRERIRLEINLNSQTAILEGYLKHKYDKAVRIVTNDDRLPWVGLDDEDEQFRLEVSDDITSTAEVPLTGEMQAAFEGYDFLVYIPAHISISAIVAEVERYKKATATYRIIQSNTI